MQKHREKLAQVFPSHLSSFYQGLVRARYTSLPCRAQSGVLSIKYWLISSPSITQKNHIRHRAAPYSRTHIAAIYCSNAPWHSVVEVTKFPWTEYTTGIRYHRCYSNYQVHYGRGGTTDWGRMEVIALRQQLPPSTGAGSCYNHAHPTKQASALEHVCSSERWDYVCPHPSHLLN